MKERGMRGIAIYDVTQDDLFGYCSEKVYPLIQMIADFLKIPAALPPNVTPQGTV